MKLGRLGCVTVVVAIVVLAALLSKPSSDPLPADHDRGDSLLAAPTHSAPTPDSDTITFNFQTANQKRMMNRMEAGATACFDRAFRGMMMQGVRSRSALIGFAENTCGQGLKRFMVSLGTPEGMAKAYVRKSAEDELNLTLRDGQ